MEYPNELDDPQVFVGLKSVCWAVKKHPVWMLYGCCAISHYNEDDMGWSLGLIPTYMGFLLSTINPVGS